MRLLMLSNGFEPTKDGWGRYSAGFLREAKRQNGEDAVDAVALGAPPYFSLRVPQPFGVVIDAWRLRRRAQRADVIHALTETTAPTAMLLGLMTGRPYVVSVHGTFGDLRAYPPSRRWIYRLAFERARMLVPVSRYTESILKHQGFARTTVVPGGFEPAARGGCLERTFGGRRLLSVGILKRRKGYHTLVRAIGLLKRDGFDVSSDIVGSVGDEAYRAELGSLIVSENVGDRVRLLGAVSQERLEELYASADLFVLPSEHAGVGFEGLGLVYLEAMAVGLPAIGCLDSGAPDVIKDGVNGLLVPPGSLETLAKSLRSLLSDEEAWSKLSRNGPRSIDAFRWERVGERTQDVYERTVREP